MDLRVVLAMVGLWLVAHAAVGPLHASCKIKWYVILLFSCQFKPH